MGGGNNPKGMEALRGDIAKVKLALAFWTVNSHSGGADGLLAHSANIGGAANTGILAGMPACSA